MKEELLIGIGIYLAVISVVTVIFTVFDKSAAKRGRRRVSEKGLFALAFIGGALAEFITMRLIRHKTKHMSFMIGLPVIIALHIGLGVWLYFR